MSADWHVKTQELYQQVTAWSHQQDGWKVESENPYDERMDESALKITTSQGERIHLEPLGHRTDGRMLVEMYAWPTLRRVRLQITPSKPVWEIVTDSGVPFHRDLDALNFVQLVHDLSDLQ